MGVVEERPAQLAGLVAGTALQALEDVAGSAPEADRLGHVLAHAEADEGIFEEKEVGVLLQKVEGLLQPVASQDECLVPAEGERGSVEGDGSHSAPSMHRCRYAVLYTEFP